MVNQLPEGFAALEPFVDRFAIAGSANRAARRNDSTRDERAAFHEAAKDLIGPALDLLDSKPLGGLDEAEARLMNMVLQFAHVALAVEVQGPDEERHASMREFMRITRTPAGAFA